MQQPFSIDIPLIFRWSWTNSTLILTSTDPQIIRVDNHAICRGWHQNQIVGGGTLKNGLCGAVFSDKMHYLKDFQVLTDISGTSKIEWQHWDMFTKRPFGIVAFKDKAFIAKVLSKVSRIDSSKTFFEAHLCSKIIFLGLIGL